MNNSKSKSALKLNPEQSVVPVSGKTSLRSSGGKNQKKRAVFQKGLSTTAITERNFEKFKWDRLQSLHAIEIQREAKVSSIARCSSTLAYVEFKHFLILTNVTNILRTCPRIQTLIFTNIRLNSFSRTFGSFLSVNLTKLVFNGSDKLTKDEMHVITFLLKRVSFDFLKALYFIRKTGDVPQPKRQFPINDISNTPSSSLVGKFLIKCASTIRTFHAERPISIFQDGAIRKSDPSILRLEKLRLNMLSPGFDVLINSQKQLTFLDCQNTEALSPYEFEAVIVCVQRCSKTLKTIQLNHKFEIRTESKYLGKPPTVVVHDCTLYSECRKIRHLRLILSSIRFVDSANIKPCRITNIAKLPLSLVSFVLNFDQLPSDGMIQFASRFQDYVRLEFLSLVGNPEWPFLFKMEWIKTLLGLPQLELLHLQNFKIKCEPAELEQLRTDMKDKLNKFLFTPRLCVIRKIKDQKFSPEDSKEDLDESQSQQSQSEQDVHQDVSQVSNNEQQEQDQDGSQDKHDKESNVVQSQDSLLSTSTRASSNTEKESSSPSLINAVS